MAMVVEARPLTSIKVTGRVRDNFGDLRELINSMRDRGQINPITIQPDGTLIAGERRWRAARELGWTKIDCHVWVRDVALDELIALEIEENTCRLDLTLTEKERAYEKLRKLEEERLRNLADAEGLADTGDQADAEDQDHPTDSGGRFRRGPSWEASDKAAKALGTNRTTMAEVREIREAAEDETQPESVRQVAQEELGKLAKSTRGASPALEKVRREKRQATRDAMSPGQWLKSDEPKAQPKATTWHTRLWNVVGTGKEIRKTAEELDVEPDTSSLDGDDIDRMMKLLQEQIVDRQDLRKVLRSIKEGRKAKQNGRQE